MRARPCRARLAPTPSPAGRRRGRPAPNRSGSCIVRSPSAAAAAPPHPSTRSAVKPARRAAPALATAKAGLANANRLATAAAAANSSMSPAPGNWPSARPAVWKRSPAPSGAESATNNPIVINPAAPLAASVQMRLRNPPGARESASTAAQMPIPALSLTPSESRDGQRGVAETGGGERPPASADQHCERDAGEHGGKTGRQHVGQARSPERRANAARRSAPQ